MLRIIFCIVFFILEVMGGKKHDYKYDNRKMYLPGYVCNYETFYLSNLNFLLYTCVHESKCKKVGAYTRSKRRPELEFDNCNFTFHPPAEGGSYICCHPEDIEGTGNNPNATLGQLQTRYMPGFRSGFKCNDYAKLVCLNAKSCPNSRRRLVKGGTETDIGKYPHLAVVGFHNKETNKQNWFCLGSVVSERFILSAATCREDIDGNFASVIRVGETELCMLGKDCMPSKYAQHIKIDKHVHHPANVLAWYYHDIMLFKLDSNIKFNSHVRPACMFCPMNTFQSGGMFALYEERTKNGKKENTIHEMELQVFSTFICSRWYSFDVRLVNPEIDPEIMFCAGLPHADKVPCTNDFGGPIQIQPEVPYCMWQIYGVMAWSQTFFCGGHKPPIFTRLPFYLEWIEEVIWYDFNMLIEHDTCSDKCKDSITISRGPEGRCKA